MAATVHSRKDCLFSVFVGRLPKDITKSGLFELFNRCGKPRDIFIADTEDTSTYGYAFVRFTTMKSCIQAVQDVHQWPLNGHRLIVDFAKDTRERIPLDILQKIGGGGDFPTPKDKTQTHTHFNDLMRLGHLKEGCIEISMDMDKTGSKSGGNNLCMLLDDVSELSPALANTIEGHIINDDLQLKNMGKKFLSSERETNSDEVSSITSQEFLSALQDIMSTINSLVESNQNKPQISISSTENKTISISAPKNGQRLVIANREEAEGAVTTRIRENMSTSATKDLFEIRKNTFFNDCAIENISERSSVSDEQKKTSVPRHGGSTARVHIPAAPTVNPALSDSFTKFMQDSSTPDNYSLRRNGLCSLISPRSSLDNAARGHKVILDSSSSMRKTSEPQRMTRANSTSNGLKDIAIVSSAQCRTNGYKNTTSDQVTWDSSDSDCQNGDSGVDSDSVPNTPRLETNDLESSMMSPVENSDNPDVWSGVLADKKIVDMYLKTVALGRGMRVSGGGPRAVGMSRNT